MPARKKVLFACTEVFAHGGIQRFNRTFLAALEELGVECDVYSLNDGDKPESSAPRSATKTAHTVSESASSPAAQAGAIGRAAATCTCARGEEYGRATRARAVVHGFGRSKVRFAVGLVKAVLTGQHRDVVIGHVHFAALIMGAVKLRRWVARVRAFGLRPAPPLRTLLVAHGTDVWTGIKGVRRWALGAVDQVLCVSEYTQNRILAQAPEIADSQSAGSRLTDSRPEDSRRAKWWRAGVGQAGSRPEDSRRVNSRRAASRLTLFPNALSRSWVTHYEGLNEVQRALPEQFIFSVARLNRADRTKGIITTIEALALLDPRVHYVIAGHGDDVEFLKATARRAQVGARVHFLGAVADEELVGLYRRCAAFVLPSSQEGFGIVFLEAMFFGAPVIAAREKGAADVVRNFETGLLVAYGDATALAASIQRVLTDQSLREHLRTHARATVSGDGVFTFRAFVQRCAAALQCHQSVSWDC